MDNMNNFVHVRCSYLTSLAGMFHKTKDVAVHQSSLFHQTLDNREIATRVEVKTQIGL